MSDPLDKYGRLGAIVGGALLGFLVFGGIALRLFLTYDAPWYLWLPISVAGPFIGAWSQLKRGDTLWKELSGRWW